MRAARLLLAIASAFTIAAGADQANTGQANMGQATIENGQKEEQRTCLPCHSLRIIHSNRLSRAGWNRELDKMAGWGARYSDRAAILEYLLAEFGDGRPVTPPEMTADGRAKQ